MFKQNVYLYSILAPFAEYQQIALASSRVDGLYSTAAHANISHRTNTSNATRIHTQQIKSNVKKQQDMMRRPKEQCSQTQPRARRV